MMLMGCASTLALNPTATTHTLPLTDEHSTAIPATLRPSETLIPTPTPPPQPLPTIGVATTTPTPITAVRWKTYTLQRYDYSIQFPSAWNIEEPDHDAAYISFHRYPGAPGELFFVSARYNLSENIADPYANLIPSETISQWFMLDNGVQARLLKTDHCQEVIWIYNDVQRHFAGCEMNSDQERLFFTIARSMAAPSQVIPVSPLPAPTTTVEPTVQAFMDAVANPVPQAFPAKIWQTDRGEISFPKTWTVSTDNNDFCGYMCIWYVATPLKVPPGFTRNPNQEPAILVSLTVTRIDEDDPYADIYDPQYHSRMITLPNGHKAILFANQDTNTHYYRLVWADGDYYTAVMAKIARDPQLDKYIPTVVAIFRSYENPNHPPIPTPDAGR